MLGIVVCGIMKNITMSQVNRERAPGMLQAAMLIQQIAAAVKLHFSTTRRLRSCFQQFGLTANQTHALRVTSQHWFRIGTFICCSTWPHVTGLCTVSGCWNHPRSPVASLFTRNVPHWGTVEVDSELHKPQSTISSILCGGDVYLYMCWIYIFVQCIFEEIIFRFLELYVFFHLKFSPDCLIAAVTKKTPTHAFFCLPVAHHRVTLMFSRKLRPQSLPLIVGLTTLSCLLFLPPPDLFHPVREKQGRGRGRSKANGRRRGPETPQAASGRLCCPGRAMVLEWIKGYAWRMK